MINSIRFIQVVRQHFTLLVIIAIILGILVFYLTTNRTENLTVSLGTPVASDFGQFTLSDQAIVNYGTDTGIVTKILGAGKHTCSPALFDDKDPAPNVPKKCYVKTTETAKDGGQFVLQKPASVYYGNGNSFVERKLDAGILHTCGPALFNGIDPSPNIVKTCSVQDIPLQPKINNLQPVPALPAPEPTPTPVSLPINITTNMPASVVIGRDGQQFTLSDPHTIYYGDDGKYVAMPLKAGPHVCLPQTFGNIDPLPNKQKACWMNSIKSNDIRGNGFNGKISENESTTNNAGPEVFFGKDNVFIGKRISGDFTCNLATFNNIDPVPGVKKECLFKEKHSNNSAPLTTANRVEFVLKSLKII
jgi:hypothetical protein